MYKEQQVVVTGPRGKFEEVMGHLGRMNVRLDLLKEFTLSDEITMIRLYQMKLTDQYADWAGLWENSEDALVEIVTCEINALSREFDDIDVSADPNYHLSPAQWAGGESPWTQNGEWVGLPGGGLGWAPDGDFLTQWAFGPDGINLFQDGQRTVPYIGEGVRIGVFDSSPFTDWEGELIIPSFAKGVRELEISLSITETIAVTEFQVPSWLMGDLGLGAAEHTPLTVWHTEVIPAPNCPGGEMEEQDLSNHGLFVAGLAHAVAPASEMYLVRVLENDGCADLYSIGEGIKAFVEEMQVRHPDEPIVVSLSLGAHEPPDPEGLGLPKGIESFQQVIDDVRKDGAVVVAAAGNDSYNVKLPPKKMEIPARDPGVIGVAASNVQRGRGCFSNVGNVAAPGGNGMDPCEIPVRDVEGEPECVCQEDASYCLIGPVYKPYESESGPRYAYWLGTSFATPLVSGQTALLLESGVPPKDVPDRIKDTADVYIASNGEVIRIINIWGSLEQ
jgi:hypothetical protein